MKTAEQIRLKHDRAFKAVDNLDESKVIINSKGSFKLVKIADPNPYLEEDTIIFVDADAYEPTIKVPLPFDNYVYEAGFTSAIANLAVYPKIYYYNVEKENEDD